MGSSKAEVVFHFSSFLQLKGIEAEWYMKEAHWGLLPVCCWAWEGLPRWSDPFPCPWHHCLGFCTQQPYPFLLIPMMAFPPKSSPFYTAPLADQVLVHDHGHLSLLCRANRKCATLLNSKQFCVSATFYLGQTPKQAVVSCHLHNKTPSISNSDLSSETVAGSTVFLLFQGHNW